MIVSLSIDVTMDATQELVARQVLERANGRLHFLHHQLREICTTRRRWQFASTATGAPP